MVAMSCRLSLNPPAEYPVPRLPRLPPRGLTSEAPWSVCPDVSASRTASRPVYHAPRPDVSHAVGGGRCTFTYQTILVVYTRRLAVQSNAPRRWTFVSLSIALGGVAALAAYEPARHATRVNAIVALGHEL